MGIEINGRLVNILLYADDIVIMAKSETEMQSLLLALDTWCKTEQLHVNIGKSKIIHFRNRRKQLTKSKFIFNREEIEKVSFYKYLGFYI